MPRILYGTAWKGADTADLVELAIRCGFRAIDTACQPKHYHEPGVGEGIARCLGEVVERGGLYIQTKFTPLAGQDPERIPYDPHAELAEQVARSFEVSRRNLGVDRLDALLLHSPLPTFEQTLEVWRAMEALVDRGGVAKIGISNCYTPRQLELLWSEARVKPSAVQNRFYARTLYDREIRDICRRNGMAYQSFWTLTANPHILAAEPVRKLASRHGWTPAQLLFRYLSQIGITPLTGTSSEEHMRQDLAIFEQTLADTDLEQLAPLFEPGARQA